jgi:putative peptidoglycan lipid II flippase
VNRTLDLLITNQLLYQLSYNGTFGAPWGMNLLRALATVSGMTLLSRILGFVRDFVHCPRLWRRVETDAFVRRLPLPNLLRRMFAEGAFSQAFVPILAEYKNKRGEEETHRWSITWPAALGSGRAGRRSPRAMAAPLIIYATAPGFSADAGKFELTVELTRITFPYIFFMSLVALAGGVLNTWSRFAIPAFTPVLLNLSFIGMALFAAPYFDPPVLASAGRCSSAAGCNSLLQLRPLAKIGMLPRFSLDFSDPGVRRILKLMAPAILGVSVSQISPADQHRLRLLPAQRQRVLAVLRRPPDGVSGRHARRSAGHHPAAQPLQDARRRATRSNSPACSTGACA